MNKDENITINPELIDEVLSRGTIVETLPNNKEFRDELLNGKKLRFYIGFDATAPTLHLSHAKNLMLLEKFRKLGHEVIVLFGDFTAMIGDPTDRSAKRAQLTSEEVLSNVKIWKELIQPLMDFDAEVNPPKIEFNSKWLAKLSMPELIELASNVTVSQMLDRSMFQKRLADSKPIFLHEFLYPLMQGYDSVAMDVDVELCGTDQIFNALVGRDLQRRKNDKNKFVVAVTLMEDPKTGELMSKSNGTGVFLDASANDMFGQIMAQTDEMIEILFVNNTHLPLQEIKEIISADNPRDAKIRLAYEITKIFHGEEQAMNAQKHFETTIQQKQAPEDVSVIISPHSEVSLLEIIKLCMPEESNQAIRQLCSQNAVRINDETKTDPKEMITITSEGILLNVGKRNWFKITI